MKQQFNMAETLLKEWQEHPHLIHNPLRFMELCSEHFVEHGKLVIATCVPKYKRF